MADELCQVAVVVNEAEQAPPKMVVEWPAEAMGDGVSIPQHQRATNAGESSAASAYLAMWAGTLLLKDAIKVESDDERDKKLKVKHGECDCC